MPMQKITIVALLLSSVLLIQTGCENSNEENTAVEGEEKTVIGGEDKYSGSKFRDHIRTTPARSPDEERRGFKLPEGFEVTLFASEPDIGKPINIAFDAKGRMWVT